MKTTVPSFFFISIKSIPKLQMTPCSSVPGIVSISTECPFKFESLKLKFSVNPAKLIVKKLSQKLKGYLTHFLRLSQEVQLQSSICLFFDVILRLAHKRIPPFNMILIVYATYI